MSRKPLEICKVEAYARKESAGGGFSFVVVVRALNKYGIEIRECEPLARVQGGTFETQSEAMRAAYNLIVERCGEVKQSTVAHFTSNKFRKNYTIWG